MAYNLGQVDASSTIDIFFTTHAQTGAAVAPLSAYEAGDVQLYKDGSATQRSSTSGWTMTSPFDSIVGLHKLTIDLSDNTDAGFYAAGHRYVAILSADTETVDGLTAVAVLAAFNIGPVSANATQILGTAISTPATAGILDVNLKNIANSAVSTSTAQLGVNAVNWGGGAIPAPNVTGVPIVDLKYILGTVLTETAGQIAAAFKKFFNIATPASTMDALTLVATATNVTTVNGLAANVITATSINADAITAAKVADGTIDAATFAAGAINAAAIATDAITAAKIAADAIGASELAADAVTEIQSGLATSAALATVQADTDDIQTRIPTALASDGSMKASLQSILGTAFTEGAGGRIAAAFKQFFNIASPAATMDHGVLTDTVTTATTATNLTNAPTAGDFTATMKTSLNNATPAVTVSDKTGFSLSSAGVQAIWDALTSALTTSGSIGKRLVDNIDVVLSTRLATSGYTTPPTAVQNADALLGRNIAGGSSTGRIVTEALRFLRNKVAIATGTMTVYDETDAVESWHAAVTTDAAAVPIITVDPS